MLLLLFSRKKSVGINKKKSLLIYDHTAMYVCSRLNSHLLEQLERYICQLFHSNYQYRP